MAATDEHPLEELGFTVIGLGLLVPVVILAYQGVQWLRLAKWVPLTLSLVWDAASIPRPQPSWLGVQAILDGLLGLPLAFVSLAIPLLGSLLVWAGAGLKDAKFRRTRHQG